jgi:hypothetical protein
MKKENQNKSWRIIDEKIQTTKIKRYPWKNILGKTLGEYTQALINKNYEPYEIVEIISRQRPVKKYIEENKKEEKKILMNLENTVHSHCCKFNMIERINKGVFK